MPLDFALKRLLAKIYRNGFGDIHQFSVEQIRQYLRMPRLNVAPATFQDIVIRENLSLRCYSPPLEDKAAILPAVIYLSASGYIINSILAAIDYCSLLANKLGMRIIQISHPMAPELTFPHYLYECVDAIEWMQQHYAQLQINPDKISIWGESSGGNVAASLTHILRDKKNKVLQHQTLIYPMVDLITEFPSKIEYAKGYLMDMSFLHYLEDVVVPQKKDRSDPRMSPLLSSNFANLPPATIITAECDPLRDEGESYSEKLISAKVPVKAQRYSGMTHGFLRFYGKIDKANSALDLACKEVKLAVGVQEQAKERY